MLDLLRFYSGTLVHNFHFNIKLLCSRLSQYFMTSDPLATNKNMFSRFSMMLKQPSPMVPAVQVWWCITSVQFGYFSRTDKRKKANLIPLTRRKKMFSSFGSSLHTYQPRPVSLSIVYWVFQWWPQGYWTMKLFKYSYPSISIFMEYRTSCYASSFMIKMTYDIYLIPCCQSINIFPATINVFVYKFVPLFCYIADVIK